MRYRTDDILQGLLNLRGQFADLDALLLLTEAHDEEEPEHRTPEQLAQVEKWRNLIGLGLTCVARAHHRIPWMEDGTDEYSDEVDAVMQPMMLALHHRFRLADEIQEAASSYYGNVHFLRATSANLDWRDWKAKMRMAVTATFGPPTPQATID